MSVVLTMLSRSSVVAIFSFYALVATSLFTTITGTKAHLPHSAVSFQQLSPTEAASQLKNCYEQIGSQSRFSEFSLSQWAGLVLHDASIPVVAGPLVPKAGSTLLREMFGDKERPKSLTKVGRIILNKILC